MKTNVKEIKTKIKKDEPVYETYFFTNHLVRRPFVCCYSTYLIAFIFIALTAFILTVIQFIALSTDARSTYDLSHVTTYNFDA